MMELLISWCVTSSILLAVFLLLRGTLGRRLSAWARYALWAVVLVRLLVPFQVPDLSLPAAAADLTPQTLSLSDPSVPVLSSTYPIDQVRDGQVQGLAILPDGRPTVSTSMGEAKITGAGQAVTRALFWVSPATLLAALWTAGVGAVLLAVLISNLHFARKLRKSRLPLPTAGCPLPVYEADGLSSPCLCGVLRPAVYLTPEAAADETVRTHVLAHELTHFRHRDHIWSLLRCLALALHWYNPLVWAAAVLSKRDGELSCDEGTIRRLGEAERIPYGRTLIGLVARRSGAGGVLSCSTTMTGGKKTVQRRIAQLVKQPETKKTALFLAAAALALAAVFVFAGGNSEPSFAQQLQAAHTIQVTFDSAYNDYDAPRITDSDLVAQAKTILLSGNPDNHTVAPGLRYTNTSVEFFNEAGRSLGFHFLSNQSMCTSLYELAREQENRTQSQNTFRVEHLAFKAQLTELFLNDPECVAQNQSPDYDMADWLTNWTTFYEVSYGVPWWDPEAPEGWYARAMDAGSWYTIAIPDHLVDAVLEICRGAAQDTAVDAASSSEMAAALEQTVSLHASFGSLSSFIGPPITDSDLVNQAKEILRSGDPQSDTTAFADLYYGSSVEFFGADGHSLGRYPLSNRDMCSALGSLAHEQMERNQIADTLASADYLQAETVLIPALLSDPDWETAVKTLDYQPEDWSAWLSLCLESLGLAPYYNPEAELFIFNSPTGTRISLPESLLQPQELFSRSASPTRVTVSSSSADVEEAAASFGTALAQFYLDLDPRHPKAVTSARLAQAEVYDTGETAFCARITLALDPVEPNTVYWMAGGGIDLAETDSPWAGLWLDTLEYRLERQADGSWRCTEAATGGLRAD